MRHIRQDIFDIKKNLRNLNPELGINRQTRWYLRGIQKLVSTYELQENSNPKCQDLPKFPFFGVGGYSRPTQIKSAKMWPNFLFLGWEGTPDQLKSKVPRCGQIFIFGGGGGYSRPTFLKYLSEGTQGILNTNLSHWS